MSKTNEKSQEIAQEVMLRVTQSFGDFKKGDAIKDPEQMKFALENNESYVVRVKAE
jgi:hypothetical protein